MVMRDSIKGTLLMIVMHDAWIVKKMLSFKGESKVPQMT